MSKVDTSGDCWLWLGSINGSGYGTFQDGSPKGVGAHRWMHLAVTGAAPSVVRHSCRNRSCVKPTHPLSGTQVDNMRDKFFDETGNTQKLNVSQVREIRERYIRTGHRTSNAKELAEEYGVSPKWIRVVASGKKLSYVR